MIEKRLSDKSDTNARRDLLDIYKPFIENGELTKEDVADDLMFLHFAGHDTTSNAVRNTLYRIKKHPEKVEAMRQELNE